MLCQGHFSHEAALEFAGREWEIWPQVMSRWLLRDFDEMRSFDHYLAASKDHVEHIKTLNPSLEMKPFLIPRSGPQLLMMGTLLSPVGDLASNENVVSFQMAADYVGSPYYPRNAQVQYQRAPLCPCDASCYRCSRRRTVGGGFLETFAFGAAAPEKMSGEVEMQAPLKPFSLPDAVGISSWGPAGAIDDFSLLAKLVNMRQSYWPVTSELLSTPQEALEYELGDGGLNDTSGLLGQLQRRASQLVLILSGDKPLDLSYKATSFDPFAAGLTDDLRALFGYYKTAA